MGMFDTVVVLDPLARLCCPDGHVPLSFRTKEIADPRLRTYLVHTGRLYLVLDCDRHDDAGDAVWHIAANQAVRQRRYRLHEVQAPRALHIYATCQACEPIVARAVAPNDRGDIVREYAVFVDYRLAFRSDEPLQVERLSGTREELQRDLRASGVVVLDDHDPLALAHRTLKAARERTAHGAWDLA